MNRISLCLFMAIKFVHFVSCHEERGRVWTWVYDPPMTFTILSGMWVGNTGCPAKSSTKGLGVPRNRRRKVVTLRQRIFLLVPASRPALRPTQPPINWVPGVLSPGVKRGRSVTLTTHPHLVPRSRMIRSCTSFHPQTPP
jgi:hypothetical protein